jgi:membrane-associated HD superfamily phosphohydrolase
MNGRQRLYYVVLTLLLALFSWAALLLPLRSQLSPAALKSGEVATQDYLAPRTATYTSELLTEQKRQEAENNIAPIYSPPDTNVARRQSERLRAALAYINTVRADTFATPQQKLEDLAAIDDLHLDQNTLVDILSLSDSRWQAVGQEAIVTLERVMSSVIRPETLADARGRVPSLVSLSLTEAEAGIAADLAAAFVAPNSFFNAELTDAARLAARDAVEPVTRTYVAGQTVVRRGQVLSDTDIEALQKPSRAA